MRMLKGILRRIANWSPGQPSTPDSLVVDVNHQRLRFQTKSDISKAWFYPRYASGTPHESAVVDWLVERLTAESQFLDVGANVGFYSVLACSICEHGRVVAVDLDPRLVSEAEQNLACNHFEHGQAICAAAWDRDDEPLSFQAIQPDNPSTNQVSDSIDDRSNPCMSLTMDTLCDRLRLQPDAVKIDVEGAEAHVIRGMSRILPRLSFLVLEVHPSSLRKLNQDIVEIYQLLDAMGFEFSIIEDHRGAASTRPLPWADQWRALKNNAVILCQRPR